MKFQKIRGTQDNLDLRQQNQLVQKMSQHFDLRDFLPIETPILEPEEMFRASLGQTSDVVGKELFQIASQNEDKICLRPEGTCGTVRAFLEKHGQSSQLFKCYSFGPMFRYERPQKGRWRQFDQFNIEAINAKSWYHDVELIIGLDGFFRHTLQMKNYVLKINYLGSQADRQVYREVLQAFLQTIANSLCQNCQARIATNPLRCLDCKNPTCQNMLANAPKIEGSLSPESKNVYESILQELRLNSVNFLLDDNLVRGLDYYQGIVFEFVSQAIGSQDAFCGGGRYDIAQKFGLKQDLPSVGAAIGTGRLLMILEQEANSIILPPQEPLFAILPVETNQQSLALHAAEFLRRHHKRCTIIWDKQSLKNQMKEADRIKAAHCIIIGPEEQANNVVKIKNMLTGQEQTINLLQVQTLPF